MDSDLSPSSIAFKFVAPYLVEKAVDAALLPLWREVRSILFPRWEGTRDAFQLKLGEAVEQLRIRDHAALESLERSFGRGEADALACALFRAAAQAITEEKMKLLAAAAAGVFTTPDLSSELRSRVARAVVALEPQDVVALRNVIVLLRWRGKPWDLVPSPVQDAYSSWADGSAGPVVPNAVPASEAYEGLLVAGCLADANVWGNGVYVTALGYAVQSALNTWADPVSKT